MIAAGAFPANSEDCEEVRGDEPRTFAFQRLASLLGAIFGRLALLLVLLLAGSFSGLVLVRMAPGFGMDERMLDSRLSADSMQAIERAGSEGSNVWQYYWQYLRRLSRGDLGTSVSLGVPVRQLVAERMSTTLRSGAAGMALAWAVALSLVTLLHMAGRRWCDQAASFTAGLLLCAPAALLALACVYLEAKPSLGIAAIIFPRLFRYLKNLTGAVCASPHVLAARAFGLSSWRVFRFHVLVPLLPELVALAGISVSMAVGALIPVEALCGSPGIGQLVWQAATARDLPVLVNVTLLITAVTAGANLLADAGRMAREQRG